MFKIENKAQKVIRKKENIYYVYYEYSIWTIMKINWICYWNTERQFSKLIQFKIKNLGWPRVRT